MKIKIQWEHCCYLAGNELNGSQLWTNQNEIINDKKKMWFFSKIRRDIFIAQWKDRIIINRTSLGKYYENKT